MCLLVDRAPERQQAPPSSPFSGHACQNLSVRAWTGRRAPSSTPSIPAAFGRRCIPPDCVVRPCASSSIGLPSASRRRHPPCGRRPTLPGGVRCRWHLHSPDTRVRTCQCGLGPADARPAGRSPDARQRAPGAAGFKVPGPVPSTPEVQSPLHSGGDASRLTALFAGCIGPICALLTPCRAGTSLAQRLPLNQSRVCRRPRGAVQRRVHQGLSRPGQRPSPIPPCGRRPALPGGVRGRWLLPQADRRGFHH